MELIINIEEIEEIAKKEWLLNTLRLMGISFRTLESPQTIAQYNADLENGNLEIESGNCKKATDLLDEVSKWK
jgi:hypothetical protein